jgi:hypothetical protein
MLVDQDNRHDNGDGDLSCDRNLKDRGVTGVKAMFSALREEAEKAI